MTPVTTKNFYNHLSNYTNNECFCFEDIDECLLEVCSEDAECTNTDGSFSCRCKRGYQGNGFNCSGLCSLLFPVTLKKKKVDTCTACIPGGLPYKGPRSDGRKVPRSGLVGDA